MLKQQDMGKAHWLSKPTLVGGDVALQSRHYTALEAGFLVPTHSLSMLSK